MIEFVIVALLGLLVAWAVYQKELLTLGGSASVLVMLLLIDGFGKWEMVVLILFGYISLSVVDKVFSRKIERSVEGIHEKSGKRSAYQVWVNGGAAVVCIVLYGITHRVSFLMGYIVGIGEAYADSLASDVGVMSKKQPLDICTWKPVTNGLSGGVSLLGSGASILGVAVYTLVTVFLRPMSFRHGAGLFLIPIIGCILDSVLGSRMQVKYICPRCGAVTEKKMHCGVKTKVHSGISWMDNSMVNLITNVVTCILGILCFEVL